MLHALSISLFLPLSYLGLILDPIAHGPAVFLPLIGVPALAIGLARTRVGTVSRVPRAAILGSLLVSHAFVFVAGLLSGALDSTGTVVAVSSFALAQAVVLYGFLRRPLVPQGGVAALGIFTVSYALGAAYLAAQAFTSAAAIA